MARERRRVGVILHGHLGGRSGRDGRGGLYDVEDTVRSLRPLLRNFDCVVVGHVWSSVNLGEAFPEGWRVQSNEQEAFPLPSNFERLLTFPETRKIYDSQLEPEKYLSALGVRGVSRWRSLSRAINLALQAKARPSTWIITRFDIDLSRAFKVPTLLPGEVAVSSRKTDRYAALNDLLFAVHDSDLHRLVDLGEEGPQLSLRPPVALKRFVTSRNMYPIAAWQQEWDFDLRRNRGLVSSLKSKVHWAGPRREASAPLV